MWHCWTKKYMLALNSHVSQLQHSTECVLSCSIMSNSLWPHGLYPTRLLFPWGFCKQEYWSGLPFPPPGDLFKPGSEPRSPAVQADSLPSESPGKPKKTGVGSLSLFQGVFPTQESNQDILHCRWILYQLSYQGSPYMLYYIINIPLNTAIIASHKFCYIIFSVSTHSQYFLFFTLFLL